MRWNPNLVFTDPVNRCVNFSHWKNIVSIMNKVWVWNVVDTFQTLIQGIRRYFLFHINQIKLRRVKQSVVSPDIQLLLLNVNRCDANVLQILTNTFYSIIYWRKEKIGAWGLRNKLTTLNHKIVSIENGSTERIWDPFL